MAVPQHRARGARPRRATLSPRRAAAAGALALTLVGATGARADEAQACASTTLAAVDGWLAAHSVRDGATGLADRVAAACRRTTQEDHVAVVAAAYETGTADRKRLVIALVGDADDVRAATSGLVVEDAWWRLRADSLHIDTAPYDLAPGVRAFGVDIAASTEPVTCVDSGVLAVRTLWVREGDRLRAVVPRLDLRTWRFSQPVPTCDLSASPDVVTEHTTATIALAPRATHGWADLVVRRTTPGREGVQARVTREMLRYDGRVYRLDGRPLAPAIVEPPSDAAP